MTAARTLVSATSQKIFFSFPDNTDLEEVLRNFAGQHEGFGLRIPPDHSLLSLEAMENELTRLDAISEYPAHWDSLSEQEKLILEKYRLALMESTQRHLARELKLSTTTSADLPPKKKTSFWAWLFYGSLLCLEAIPNLWGGFLGLSAVLASTGLPGLAIMGISLLLCSIQAVIYYAVVGPLVKDSLGIPNEVPASPLLETISQQLDSFNEIDRLMSADNTLSAAEYAKYVRLTRLFYRQMNRQTEFRIRLADSLDEIRTIEEKSLVIIDNMAYCVCHGERMRLAPNGPFLETELSDIDRQKLLAQPRDAKNHILSTPDNTTFLNGLVRKAKTALSPRGDTTVPRFEESIFVKGMIWMMGIVGMILNVGNGYFFALSLLTSAAATAALAGTPIGWCVVGFVVLGQIALRFAIGSNAMTNLFNPHAPRQKDIHEKINRLESRNRNYLKIQHDKEAKETLVKDYRQAVSDLHTRPAERERAAQKNPYVDSWRGSYTQQGLLAERSRAPLPRESVVNSAPSVTFLAGC